MWVGSADWSKLAGAVGGPATFAVVGIAAGASSEDGLLDRVHELRFGVEDESVSDGARSTRGEGAHLERDVMYEPVGLVVDGSLDVKCHGQKLFEVYSAQRFVAQRPDPAVRAQVGSIRAGVMWVLGALTSGTGRQALSEIDSAGKKVPFVNSATNFSVSWMSRFHFNFTNNTRHNQRLFPPCVSYPFLVSKTSIATTHQYGR